MKKWMVMLVVCLSGSAFANELGLPSLITFGSCTHQNKSQEHWAQIVEVKPDLFIMLGDNIYGDTRDMAVLKAKWDQLGTVEGFRALKAICPIEAIWDDHDYGENDAGASYPLRQESQKLFLDFYGASEDDPRRRREGIYHATLQEVNGQRLQIIYLDTRYFRGRLKRMQVKRERGEGFSGPYVPLDDASVTLLGAEQWAWLEKQLLKPADLRIVATSIQFVAQDHGWEKWGNLPHERRRMLDLITRTRANGVIFISGDRHRGEISRLSDENAYPLFDITSSALNNAAKGFRNEVNVYRYGTLYADDNFGSLAIDWAAKDPLVRMQIRSAKNGQVVAQHKVLLSTLTFDADR